jgi:hypothetical protein
LAGAVSFLVEMKLMKKFQAGIALIFFAITIVLVARLCRNDTIWNSFKNPETTKMLKRFVTLKETQANADSHECRRKSASCFDMLNVATGWL